MNDFFRPEWTCGRYNKKSRHAIMYNLLEGNVFLFRDETADLIGEIFKTKKGKQINLECISKSLGFELNDIIDFFNGELAINKLVVNNPLSTEEIINVRKKTSDNRKSNFTIKKELKSQAYTFGDVQDDYQTILQGNDIPFNAVLELTYTCNERCIHCYNPGAARNSSESNNRKTNELTTKDYEKIIHELKDLGVVRVLLTGGDPFMRKDIWEIIEMLYDNDFAFEIKTNGLGLLGNENRLSKFYPYEVSFSVYSGIEATHDSITNIKGSFNKTIKCIENLSDLGINVKLNCVIMKPNAKDYYTATKIANKFAYKIAYDLKLSNALDGDVSVTKNLQVTDELLEVILRDERVSIFVGENTAKEGKITKNSEDAVCVAGINLIGIDPMGNVMPCHAFPLILGNIKTDSLDKIMQSKISLNWKRKSSFKYFDICGKKDYCDYCTLCVGDNFVDNKTPYKPNMVACHIANTRMIVANKLIMGIDPLKGQSIEEKLIEYEMSDLREFGKEII